MWFKHYRDYKNDEPLIKAQVSSNHGITGCEMHDLNGWGITKHFQIKKKRKGIFDFFIKLIIKRE